MELRRGRPAIVLGIGAGFFYGIVARLAFSRPRLGLLFSSMTYGFIFFVPFAVGYVTVAPIESPTWTQRLLLPWLTSFLLLGTAALVGWEGSLCLVLAAPAVLVSSSVGGLLAAAVRGSGRGRRAGAAVILGLPFLVAPLEDRVGVEPTVRTVETSVRVGAPADAVWSEIVQVPAITREEFRPRLIHRAGLPRPIAATIEGAGVGAVRQATFAGGITFIETVDEWREGRALGFRIEVDPGSARALDEHVEIGGEHFDVLQGRYEIEEREGAVNLHLTSRYRLSTPLRGYAALWADHIMRSIQESILEVIAARAEAR